MIGPPKHTENTQRFNVNFYPDQLTNDSFILFMVLLWELSIFSSSQKISRLIYTGRISECMLGTLCGDILIKLLSFNS